MDIASRLAVSHSRNSPPEVGDVKETHVTNPERVQLRTNIFRQSYDKLSTTLDRDV